MKKRAALAVLLLAAGLAALPLGGCEFMLKREFYTSAPHSLQHGGTDISEGNVIKNYYALKDAILNTVYAGKTDETFRLNEYGGDMEKDIENIIADIMKSDPICAYAVSSINFEPVKILSLQEATLSITYKRGMEEVDKIEQAVNTNEFEQKMALKMAQYQKNSCIYIINYFDYTYDAYTRILSSYYGEDGASVGLESINLAFYPESGVKRIIETDVRYINSDMVLSRKREIIKEEASRIASQIFLEQQIEETGGNDGAVARVLYDWVIDNIEYDSDAQSAAEEAKGRQIKTDEYTAYGAFAYKKAAGEGIALAYQALCKAAGLDAYIVIGEDLNGNTSVWSLVNIEGEYYHIDAGEGIKSKVSGNDLERDAFFAISDEQMQKTKLWDVKYYTASDTMSYEERRSEEAAATENV